MSATVKHEGPGLLADSGSQEEISGTGVTPFSEQGMQDDGMAHPEGEEETKQEPNEELDRTQDCWSLEGHTIETLEEEVQMTRDDPQMHEDDKVDEGRKPS